MYSWGALSSFVILVGQIFMFIVLRHQTHPLSEEDSCSDFLLIAF